MSKIVMKLMIEKLAHEEVPLAILKKIQSKKFVFPNNSGTKSIPKICQLNDMYSENLALVANLVKPILDEGPFSGHHQSGIENFKHVFGVQQDIDLDIALMQLDASVGSNFTPKCPPS